MGLESVFSKFSLQQFLRIVGMMPAPLLSGIPVLIAIMSFVFADGINIGHYYVPNIKSGELKELGFFSSINWSITYTLLFPLFMQCIVLNARTFKIFLRELTDEKFLFNTEKIIKYDEILVMFNIFLNKNNIIFILIIITSFFLVFSGWISGCLRPLLFQNGDINFTIDWPTGIILDNSIGNKYSFLIFSFFAYLYLGLTLSIYLTGLFLGWVYISFIDNYLITNFSEDEKNSIDIFIIYRRSLLEKMSRFLDSFSNLCNLGLITSILMFIHYYYIFSDADNLIDFLLADAGAVCRSFPNLKSACDNIFPTKFVQYFSGFQRSGASHSTYFLAIILMFSCVSSMMYVMYYALDFLKKSYGSFLGIVGKKDRFINVGVAFPARVSIGNSPKFSNINSNIKLFLILLFITICASIPKIASFFVGSLAVSLTSISLLYLISKARFRR